jgi:spore maturation protein CgeB
MRILVVDTTQYYPSSPLLASALPAFNSECSFFDEAKFFGDRSIAYRIIRRLRGGRPLRYRSFNRELLRCAAAFRPSLLVVVKGQYISPRTLRQIKASTGAVTINYATDDPFNPRNSTDDLIASIPHYDIYASTKRAIIPDIRKTGCTTVMYVPFGYKPDVHFPDQSATSAERKKYDADVVFIGGADVDRVPYFQRIVKDSKARLALYGGYWHRQPELRYCARGFVMGRAYRLALGCAKIAVGLVRSANRDDHAMRSFEIPACGAFLLAERTEAHMELFSEGKEAAFFSSADELVDKVRYYLEHESERRRIATNGYRRVIDGGNTYLDRLRQIVAAGSLG